MSGFAHWHNLKWLPGSYCLGSNLPRNLNVCNGQQMMENNVILSSPCQPLLSQDCRKAPSPTSHFNTGERKGRFARAPNETDKHILVCAEALLGIRRCKYCICILSVPQHPTMTHRGPTDPRAARSRYPVNSWTSCLNFWGRGAGVSNSLISLTSVDLDPLLKTKRNEY